jgi:hypothetical protein
MFLEGLTTTMLREGRREGRKWLRESEKENSPQWMHLQ